MPELPEVELVAKSLDKLVKRRKIIGADLLRQKLAPFNSSEEFGEKLNGAAINGVNRRGKHILFDFDNNQTLIAHLRMTGRFLLLQSDSELPKFTHAVFYFTDDEKLIFTDQRHFGFMRLLETEKLLEIKEIKNLAPEPFSEEFNRKYFRLALETSKRSLKEFLLDQTKVCGLGNIYACEAMFLAKVNPQIPANQISTRKADILFQKIREVLAEAITHGSSLNVDPQNIDGNFYNADFERKWRVYDRENEPCSNCETEISRLKQAGRSSYFCRKCQK